LVNFINDFNSHETKIAKMAPKNVFITGTTGFIGGDVFYALNKAQPSWNYTILVRSEDKGKDVQKQYPDVKLAIGSLDDSEVIKKAASEADIVIHTAESSDHQGSARAIAAGLRSTHSSSNPGYYIHISGTGILCWYDQDNKRYGKAPLPEQSYNDLEGVDKVTSLPDTAFHRDVDKIVLEEAAKDPEAVKVAIVCPPTIYGTGRGPTNQRSRQIPGLAETTLEKGFGPIIGAGKTEWDNVHVYDLSKLLVQLSERAASSEKKDEQELWGPKGYFFAENGKHKWSEISTLIAKEASKQGLIDSDETKVLDVDEAQKKLGFQALSWGLNSHGEAKRARKYLGWKPESPSLEEWVPELVQTEAKLMGKA
jgi:nucleoside-diphosphate-sugar epimerase